MIQTQTDRLIENTSLFLDGIRFIRCRFVNCQLIYEAKDEVEFKDCTFERCSWTFDGAAERTISFLSTLYHGGDGGSQLVEAIFESIQNKRIAEIRLSANSDMRTEGLVVNSSQNP
jgi:hypothetical protein